MRGTKRYRIRKAFYLAIILLGLPFLLSAQYDQLSFFDLQINGQAFRHRVNTLFVDSYGFLWIGTNTGLYQYDGNRLKSYQYDVFDPESIPNNGINSIVEDQFHNLWLGSESYLIRFDRQTESFSGYYKNQTSICLGVDEDGTVWANLRKIGLARITPAAEEDDLQFETHFNYVSSGVIQKNLVLDAYCEDELGRIWLGTPSGLYYLDDELQLQASNFTETVTAVIRGAGQRLWVSTPKELFELAYDKGPEALTVHSRTALFEEQQVESQRILGLLQDQDGQLWVGTSEGLYRTLPHASGLDFRKVHLQTTGNLKTDRIQALQLDPFGNIWIGSSNGVGKVVSRSLAVQFNALPSLDPTLKNQRVMSPTLDPYGRLWFGLHEGGLYRFDLETKQLELIAKPPGRVNVIRRDFSGKGLLIGWGNQLFSIADAGAAKPVLQSMGTYERGVHDVVALSEQEMWLGLWDRGLRIRSSDEKRSAYKEKLLEKTLGHNISVMQLDSRQNLWIGTRGDGLYRVDLRRQSFEHYQPSRASGLTSNAFLCLLEDREGTIWMGTRGGGLIRYRAEENRFTAYQRRDGMLSNTISAIEEDHLGNLWLSTPEGLLRFNKATEGMISLTEEDGIMESQFVYNSSAFLEGGRRLLFGTTNGFYEIDAHAFRPTVQLPHTVITSINILDHREPSASSFVMQHGSLVVDSSSITLPYFQNNFSLEFASLDLTAPYKNQYAYMLEGVNDNWIISNENVRNASYYDLSPGTYLFKVKSTNSDGQWTPQPTTLEIRIRPPFWLTHWAYAIYSLLILGILFLLIIIVRRWYRLKKELLKETVSREKDNQHHKMRMVFFTDISHELRTPLTLIISSIEQLLKEPAKLPQTRFTQRIHDSALKMKQLIDQIMDIRKFSEGEFKLQVNPGDAAAHLRMITATFSDYAALQQIQLAFSPARPEIPAWFDAVLLEKVTANLLSNALKFTEAGGKISVVADTCDLSREAADQLGLPPDTYLRITVEDNGLGMNETDLAHIFDRYYQSSNKLKSNLSSGTGIGMELVAKLVKLHRGHIGVASRPDEFTRFTVHLPLQKQAYHSSEIGQVEPGLPPRMLHEAQQADMPETSPAAVVKPREYQKASILLVEDNEELRNMMKEVLSNHYQVLEAGDGNSGFHAALKYRPDLIISDILMPEEDGISMLRRLKAEETTVHIPVFLLTAKVTDEVKRESLQLGAENFIIKPFSMDFLEWRIANTLKTRKLLEEKYSKVISATPSAVELESPDERLIRELVQLVEDHLEDPRLNVVFLANQVGMSRANLYRKLQKITGDTPVNFIRQIRLKRAKQILEMNKFHISEVAYMCGFKSHRYFSRCFAKEYGCTPKKFVMERV